MTAQELRIGNWVTFTGSDIPFKVVSLDLSSDGIGVKTDSGCVMDFSKEFFPIPLTPEILEKAGFSFDGYNWAKNGVSLSWYSRVIATNKYSGISVSDAEHINEVHLLQNYYYFKTGEELNIEL